MEMFRIMVLETVFYKFEVGNLYGVAEGGTYVGQVF